MTSFPDYKYYEYGFLVVSFDHSVVRRIGHEGYMDTEAEYRYTEPHTDQSRTSIQQSIPPQFKSVARALCHNHPTYGTFSTTDFNGFKKLRDLTSKHVLKYDIAYYLLQADGQVRRS